MLYQPDDMSCAAVTATPWDAPGFAGASLGLLLSALLPELLRPPVLAVLRGGRWLAAKMLTRCRRRSRSVPLPPCLRNQASIWSSNP